MAEACFEHGHTARCFSNAKYTVGCAGMGMGMGMGFNEETDDAGKRWLAWKTKRYERVQRGSSASNPSLQACEQEIYSSTEALGWQ